MLIHVVPEEIRHAALKVDMAVMDFYHYRSSLYSSLNQMEMSWTGSVAAEEMTTAFREILEVLDQQILELDQFGIRLAHQADSWEMTDLEWAAHFRSNGTV